MLGARRQTTVLRDAEVRFAPPLPYALVLIPRTLRPGEIEKLAVTLSIQAAKGKLVAGKHKVVDVTAALAKNTPAELDRKRIMRIDQLGAGHYGEVSRNERSRISLLNSDCFFVAMRGPLVKKAAVVPMLEATSYALHRTPKHGVSACLQ